MISSDKIIIFLWLVLLVGSIDVHAQSDIPGDEAVGRWDITVSTPHDGYAAWMEIKRSGRSALVGQFVGGGGSARPISEINFSEKDDKYNFSIPPQWSEGEDIYVEFSLKKGELIGWIKDHEGDKFRWRGVRAPELRPKSNIEWGTPIRLLEEGLSDWKVPEEGWLLEDGVLRNNREGGNLITKEEFDNFKLHIEFRYTDDANSGIYLRGRYEIQIIDSYERKPSSILLGGVYGFIDPNQNAAKRAGEWQTYDITLNGRMITVVLNGTRIICERMIPGITGEALDSKEGEPGPLLLQGNNDPGAEYRNIVLTPEK